MMRRNNNAGRREREREQRGAAGRRRESRASCKVVAFSTSVVRKRERVLEATKTDQKGGPLGSIILLENPPEAQFGIIVCDEV